MSTVGKGPKKASDHIPFMRDQGMSYIVGAQDENKVVIAGTVTLVAGAASVDLQGTHGVTMVGTDYQVLLTSDGAVAAWASKAVDGFDIAGTGTDVVDYLVIGQVSAMATAD